MTYRVEVTAATINELSGKLAALASQLKGLPSTFDVLRVEASEINLPVQEQVEERELTQAPVDAPAPEPEARAYDYNTEIAPRVLELVSKRGRDAVKTLLAGFGVTRASELDASRHDELLAAVAAAMEV